jgi:hypothetical protein
MLLVADKNFLIVISSLLAREFIELEQQPPVSYSDWL